MNPKVDYLIWIRSSTVVVNLFGVKVCIIEHKRYAPPLPRYNTADQSLAIFQTEKNPPHAIIDALNSTTLYAMFSHIQN